MEEVEKQQNHFEWLKLIVWYIGVIISFIPIFVEALVYLATHPKLDKVFFIMICAKGDVIWILATLMILTLVECYTGSIKLKSKLKLWIGLFGTIVWGICCLVWVIFKYIYPENFGRSIVVWICCIIGILVLVICTTLQLGYVEVEK